MAPSAVDRESAKGIGHGGGGDSGVSQRVFGTYCNGFRTSPTACSSSRRATTSPSSPPDVAKDGSTRFLRRSARQGGRPAISRCSEAAWPKYRGIDDARSDAADGLSGSELEQAIVAGPMPPMPRAWTSPTQAFPPPRSPRDPPLSVTSAEKIDRLRSWAEGRAVPAV